MTRTKSQRKRRSKASDYQSYIFHIEDSCAAYTLRIDRGRWAEGPYWEHLELTVRGTIVSPEDLKGRRGILTFLGDRRITRDLENPIESRSQPICLGTLTVWGETTNFLGSLPHDAIWHVVHLLARGEMRMLALHGKSLYRGKAEILTINFEREIDPEVW